ncbi:MAG: YfiR family protein [Bacteroidota bacterium]
MKRFQTILAFFIVMVSCLAYSVKAQNIDYSVHANIIYHLTKYMEWPGNKNEPVFVIGVIGDSPLFEELQSATLNKEVNNKKIIIRKFSCAQRSYSCQILFISEDESRCLKNIAELTAITPVLIITEKEGLALKGSCINFIIDDGRLKLEINKNNIEEHTLKIATELLNLGIVVTNDKLTKK